MIKAIRRPNLLPNDLSPARPVRASATAAPAAAARSTQFAVVTSPDHVPGGLPHDRHVFRHGRGVREPVLGGVVEEFDRQLLLALSPGVLEVEAAVA